MKTNKSILGITVLAVFSSLLFAGCPRCNKHPEEMNNCNDSLETKKTVNKGVKGDLVSSNKVNESKL